MLIAIDHNGDIIKCDAVGRACPSGLHTEYSTTVLGIIMDFIFNIFNSAVTCMQVLRQLSKTRG